MAPKFLISIRVLILLVLLQFVFSCTEEHITPKPDDIAKILQKAKEGDSSAQCQAATIYNEGKGTAINQENASYWYLMAARQDVTMAQTRIGVRLVKGLGIKKDVEEGLHWLEKAANKNDSLAQMALSGIYLGELNSGLNNFGKAFYWMLNAAKSGVAPAQFEVYRMYRYGIGTETNLTQGDYWLRKAAEAGYPSAIKVLREVSELQEDLKKTE
jgi:TPR repeat protein